MTATAEALLVSVMIIVIGSIWVRSWQHLVCPHGKRLYCPVCDGDGEVDG